MAAPVLEVTDLGTGGPVTVTLTGGDALATNAVYYQSYTGALEGGVWTLFGSRTGNGTIATSITKGFYWWYCKSTLGAVVSVSNLVKEKVADIREAVQERMLDAAAALITLLELRRIKAVERRKVPWDLNLLRPCILVTTFGYSETVLGGTNGHDDFGRPIYLYTITDDAHDDSTEADVHYWRQKLFRAFSAQRLPGVPEVIQCEIEPVQIVALDEEKINYEYSALAVRAHTREVRGFGA